MRTRRHIDRDVAWSREYFVNALNDPEKLPVIDK